MMARVEGMPRAALEHGVPWRWETFGEYLDALEGRIGLNAGFIAGHSALRRYILGIKAAGSSDVQRHYSLKLAIVATDNNVFSGPGVTEAGLTKLGRGTLSLEHTSPAAVAYSGNTVVGGTQQDGGTLRLAANAALSLNAAGNNITDAFIEYALPLIGGPLPGYFQFEDV